MTAWLVYNVPLELTMLVAYTIVGALVAALIFVAIGK